MSTWPTQAGAVANTTLKNLSLEKCAAHAVADLQARLMRVKMITLVVMAKVKLVAMTELVVMVTLVHALILRTSMLPENESETPMEIIVMSTLTTQTGVATTTLKNLSLERCAAHAVAVPQAKLMRAKMTALRAMKETIRVKETKAKEMKVKEKVRMTALEATKKMTLVMTQQEKKDNASMTI